MKKILTSLILLSLLAGCSGTAGPESNRDLLEGTSPQGIDQTSTTSPLTTE